LDAISLFLVMQMNKPKELILLEEMMGRYEDLKGNVRDVSLVSKLDTEKLQLKKSMYVSDIAEEFRPDEAEAYSIEDVRIYDDALWPFCTGYAIINYFQLKK